MGIFLYFKSSGNNVFSLWRARSLRMERMQIRSEKDLILTCQEEVPNISHWSALGFLLLTCLRKGPDLNSREGRTSSPSVLLAKIKMLQLTKLVTIWRSSLARNILSFTKVLTLRNEELLPITVTNLHRCMEGLQNLLYYVEAKSELTEETWQFTSC